MAVVQWEVTLVDFTLMADLVLRLRVYGVHCLRAGMGWDMVFEVDLCSVPFIVEDDSVKLTLRAAVFLLPLRPWVGGVMPGLSKSISGLWKVTCFAVFLKPPGVGEEGTLRISIWDCTARFGTLTSKIPSLSDVA